MSNKKLSNVLGLGAAPGAEKTNYNKGNIRTGFNATNQAVSLATYLSDPLDYGGEDEKAFDIILDYNDDELRAVHNAWVEKFKGVWLYTGKRDTLRKQVAAEAISSSRKTVVAKKNRILGRLDKLNL